MVYLNYRWWWYIFVGSSVGFGVVFVSDSIDDDIVDCLEYL